MKKIVYILIVFLGVSCTSRTIYKKPENLIPKNQMVDLWTDIYIANAARTVKNKEFKKRVNYMPFVYQKYKIDSVRFTESNLYYTSRIEDYEKMFKQVQERLKKTRTIYDPRTIDADLPAHKKDSIKRSKKRILKKSKDSLPFKRDSLNLKKVKELKLPTLQ